mmetsp:Transcript_14361/g.21089  ORF Transcript_14361/g.21089 Transcript_14361/m.21089 type:complete len:408 (+) Transcript_14361:92-1315(+)
MVSRRHHYLGLALVTILASFMNGTGASAVPKVNRPINNLPPEEFIGKNINRAELKLCASLSQLVYQRDIYSRKGFQKRLDDLEEIKEAFPDVDLDVRWFSNGVSIGKNLFSERLTLNDPTFVGVVVDDTLVLCFRGTISVRDLLEEAKFESIIPKRWKVKGLEIQQRHSEMVDSYLRSHGNDIKKYLTGKFMDDPGKKWDGKTMQTPIKKVICTGHSLGGGLAQVAHLYLTAPGAKWNVRDSACVETIAFSAPMTIAVKDDLDEGTEQFLEEDIKPAMRNIVFKDDVIPRIASNFGFLNSFLNEFDNDDLLGGVARKFAEPLVELCRNVLVDKKDELGCYCHIGKLIYYDNYDAAPKMYEDWIAKHRRLEEDNDFKTLSYDKPEGRVADTAFSQHMALIKPGLAFGS